MKIEVPPLPYSQRALAPYLSARTLNEHYEKHHKGYLRKLMKLVRGRPEEKLSLEELIRTGSGDVFENAAQIWNHDFYWRCMRPGGGGRPSKSVGELLATSFGSVANCKRRLAEAANERFGSGWAWLMRESPEQGGRMRIESTANAENPLQKGCVPLLVIDVWEHAYYLDYRSERDRYVKGFLDHLVNWDFVEENLVGAQPLRDPVESDE